MKPPTVLVSNLSGVGEQAGQRKNSARSSEHILYGSETLSSNPLDSSVYLKQLGFKQK
jgi:hypothetical protein